MVATYPTFITIDDLGQIYFKNFIFWLSHVTCGILVPQSGMNLHLHSRHWKLEGSVPSRANLDGNSPEQQEH